MAAQPPSITPERIWTLGFAYWGSKTLLSAVELGVFSALAAAPLDAEALRQRLGLHPRSARDFFDALVALGMLEREGEQSRNTPEADPDLDRAKPRAIAAVSWRCPAPACMLLGGAQRGPAHRPAAERVEERQDFFAALYQNPGSCGALPTP